MGSFAGSVGSGSGAVKGPSFLRGALGLNGGIKCKGGI